MRLWSHLTLEKFMDSHENEIRTITRAALAAADIIADEIAQHRATRPMDSGAMQEVFRAALGRAVGLSPAPTSTVKGSPRTT